MRVRTFTSVSSLKAVDGGQPAYLYMLLYIYVCVCVCVCEGACILGVPPKAFLPEHLLCCVLCCVLWCGAV